MRIIVTAVLFVSCIDTFCQNVDSPEISIRNCHVNGEQIDSLNGDSFEFLINYEIKDLDTLRLELVLHRDNSRLIAIKYIYTRDDNRGFRTSNLNRVKPGDGISFLFKYKGSRTEKTYWVRSTTKSLARPYYVDVFFVYNKDTLATSKFIFHSKLEKDVHKNFIRLFFDEPGALPKKLRIEFGKRSLDYPFDWGTSSLFHGRVIMEYFDKKNLKKNDMFNERIDLIDLDSGYRLGHGSMSF